MVENIFINKTNYPLWFLIRELHVKDDTHEGGKTIFVAIVADGEDSANQAFRNYRKELYHLGVLVTDCKTPRED